MAKKPSRKLTKTKSLGSVKSPALTFNHNEVILRG
jgi:hypothetical protein